MCQVESGQYRSGDVTMNLREDKLHRRQQGIYPCDSETFCPLVYSTNEKRMASAPM